MDFRVVRCVYMCCVILLRLESFCFNCWCSSWSHVDKTLIFGL